MSFRTPCLFVFIVSQQVRIDLYLVCNTPTHSFIYHNSNYTPYGKAMPMVKSLHLNIYQKRINLMDHGEDGRGSSYPATIYYANCRSIDFFHYYCTVGVVDTSTVELGKLFFQSVNLFTNLLSIATSFSLLLQAFPRPSSSPSQRELLDWVVDSQ